MPSSGQCVKAAIIASCTASSAEEKSRNRRATAPSTCGASSRNRCSEVASHGFVIAALVTASPVEAHSYLDVLQSACSGPLHPDPARPRLSRQGHKLVPE